MLLMAQRSAAFDGELGPSRFVVTMHGDTDLVAQLLDVLFEALDTDDDADFDLDEALDQIEVGPDSIHELEDGTVISLNTLLLALSPARSAATSTTPTACRCGSGGNAACSPSPKPTPCGPGSGGAVIRSAVTAREHVSKPTTPPNGKTVASRTSTKPTSSAGPTTAGSTTPSTNRPPRAPTMTGNEEPRPKRGPDHLSRFPAASPRPTHAGHSLFSQARTASSSPVNWPAMASTEAPSGSTVAWRTTPLAAATRSAAIGWGSIQSGSRSSYLGQLLGEQATELRPQDQDPLVQRRKAGRLDQGLEVGRRLVPVLVEGRDEGLHGGQHPGGGIVGLRQGDQRGVQPLPQAGEQGLGDQLVLRAEVVRDGCQVGVGRTGDVPGRRAGQPPTANAPACGVEEPLPRVSHTYV